jgi:hypothetical protein
MFQNGNAKCAGGRKLYYKCCTTRKRSKDSKLCPARAVVVEIGGKYTVEGVQPHVGCERVGVSQGIPRAARAVLTTVNPNTMSVQTVEAALLQQQMCVGRNKVVNYLRHRGDRPDIYTPDFVMKALLEE